jgi:serine/threonine protein phosphatase PrpC
VTAFSDDALERRIARFVSDIRVAKALNSVPNVCLGTNLGSVRKENQDRALVVWANYPDNPDRNFTLAVLSDGMGGLTNGGEAATTTLSVFISRVLRTPRLAPPDRLRNAALYSNNAVYSRFGGRGGATLSAVFITDNGPLLGINIGDSRIYAVNKAHGLLQLSRDDTLAGILGEEDTSHENHGRLIQFMGMGEGIEPNIIEADRSIIETVLITSDGVHGSSTSVLNQIARRSRSEADLTRKLLSLSDLLGGQDNGTAIVLGTKQTEHMVGGEQGLNLTFLSANDRLEVWIPVLGEDVRQERPRTLEVEKNETVRSIQLGPSVSSELSKSNAIDSKKKRKSRPRVKEANKNMTAEEQVLPLDDEQQSQVLDVRFPSPRGDLD